MAQTKIQSVQLSDTGVVPGTYTTANVTVDSAGRVTSVETGDPGDTVVEPATQVVYGTGTGITSDPTLTYDASISTMVVGEAGPAMVESSPGEQLTVHGDSKLALSSTGSIDINAELTFNDVPSVDGKVLTARGPGLAPEWVTPSAAAGPVEPATQIVYGTGTGVDSDSTLTYDTATSTMVVGSLTDHALIESEDNFDLVVSSGGYLVLAAKSGDVEIVAPFGSIVIYSELQTNGSGGSYGDVLTSRGSGTPPVWEAPLIPIGGGAEPIYSWRLQGTTDGSFDGSLYNSWGVTHYNHNFVSPKVAWNDTDQRFDVNDYGTYEMTISATLTAFPYIPVGPTAYGLYLAINNGQSYSVNPTFHTRDLDPNEYQFAPYPANEAYGNETWTETFIISVQGLGCNIAMQAYAYNYSNASASVPYINLTMTMQKINDYVAVEA